MRTAVARCGVLLACAAPPAPLHAQTAHTAVLPRGITIGDVFHAVIRVDAPPAVRVAFPDSLLLAEPLERAGRRDVRLDTLDTGDIRWTALYPVTAWRTGSQSLPAVAVEIGGEADATTLEATFPAFDVRSVLPADTAGIQPKEAKDVLGASRLWWPWLLLLLLLALAAAALYAWYRRRRRTQPLPVLPLVPPRQLALDRLDQVRAAGWLERGAWKPFYSGTTDALRHYLAAVDPRLGVDLTSTELLARMRQLTLTPRLVEVTRVLAVADMVKFAGARSDAVEAAGVWEAARGCVERFDAPAPGSPDDAERVAA